VIPGRADFSLDLRGSTDAARDAAWDQITTMLDEVAEKRSLVLEVVESHTAPAAPCARWLQEAVIAGIRTTGDDDPMGIWSRAGHDAMAIAEVTDIGMLFLRCYDGISHHPGEDVRLIDVARGLDAFEQTILAVAAAYDAGQGRISDR
jgi:allantoate deiminase